MTISTPANQTIFITDTGVIVDHHADRRTTFTVDLPDRLIVITDVDTSPTTERPPLTSIIARLNIYGDAVYRWDMFTYRDGHAEAETLARHNELHIELRSQRDDTVTALLDATFYRQTINTILSALTPKD